MRPSLSPRTLLTAAAIAASSGCALDAETFEERYLDAFCAYQASCDPPLFQSDDRCREAESIEREDFAACELDPALARACLTAIQELQCEGSAANYPAACQPETTYDCPAAE